MTNPPLVYVVNEPLTRDTVSNGLARVFDLTPALEFGQLCFLLPAGRVPTDPESMIAELREGLMSFRAEDYLLPVGDTVAIGVATALAAQRTGGVVKMLRWVRRSRLYQSMYLDLTEPCDVEEPSAYVEGFSR